MSQRAALSAAPSPPAGERSGAPIGTLAFLGVTVSSLGGPLALAALYAPTILPDASGSAGFVTAAAAVVFAVPLLVWLRYSREITTSAGLSGFVAAAAGPRVALVQAGLWIISYLLYLVYTTASIVYDTLPTVLPGVHAYRPVLEIALPIAIATVMLAGRTVTLAVTGALAAGQLALVATLAAVTIGHDAPTASFATHPPVGALSSATGQTALLYVCGSLPLFLGGETARPTRTVRRGLTTGYLLVAAAVVAAVFPLAANPAFTRAPIPGMSIAQVFAGHPFAVTIGIGVAASIAGLILVEYLALSRLLHSLTGYATRPVITALAIVLVGTAPITLINPDRVYQDLLKPSLIALWLSQLIVFAVYPRLATRNGRALPAWALATGASALAIYGLYATIHHTTT